MAQLGLGIAGWYAFGPIGGLIGSFIGGYIDRRWLFPPDAVEGPRLEDLKVQSSAYGVPINQIWGAARLAGNLIWADEITEVEVTTEVGGKGGGGQEITGYEYYASFAIGICNGPVDKITKIWADSKLIYDITDANNQVVRPGRRRGLSIDQSSWVQHLGDESQTPDPIIEAVEGEGNVPAFRGLVYMVFKDFPLEDYGNRIPNFNFEVVTDATSVITVDPLEELAASIYGSDSWVAYADGIHIMAQASGHWYKLSVITGDVVAYAFNSGIPSNTQKYDIDETGTIYASNSDVRLQTLDGDTLLPVKESSSTFTYGCDNFAVSRNPNHPWLYFSGISSSRIYAVDRGDLAWGAGAAEEFTAPVGVVKQIAVDHDSGDAFVVCSDLVTPDTTYVTWLDNTGTSHVQRNINISSYIRGGRYICFDADSNQLIVGTNDDDGNGPAIAFFDVTDLGPIHTLTFSYKMIGQYVGAYGYSEWKRGVVNGSLFVSYVSRIKEINVADHRVVNDWETSLLFNGGSLYDPLTHSVFQMVSGQTYNACKILLDRTIPNAVQLSEIVTDICEQVDLGAADIDVTALTDSVRGFVINNRMSARAAIEALMNGFFFDGVESDGKLKFVKRGGSSSLTIPESDLAAHKSGDQRPMELLSIRSQETDLPIQVDVRYIDFYADYDPGLQSERRLISRSENKLSLSLPIVMTADEAKQAAVKHLANLWTMRTKHIIEISREYYYLDPADVITVTEGGQSHLVRIEDLAYKSGLLEVNLANEDPQAYISDASGVPLPEHEQDVIYEGPTRLVLIDCPMLLDTHNKPGLYFATLGYLNAWRGAVLFKSLDGGASWSEYSASARDATVGKATDVLGDVADPFVWDDGNSVNIRLLDTTDSLTSATQEEVLNGSNAAILGDEIIQYTTVVAESDGTYTLSGLLRGRRGTDWATADHAAGDTFVVLASNKINFEDFPVNDMDVERHYVAVSIGMSMDTGNIQAFTCELRNMMPLSPQHISGSRDASNDLTISWIRRTRVGGEWRDLYGVPLGENSEAYELDIYGGSTVVRTINASSESATYTAAQQTADGLTPGDPVDLAIYQISDTVGRGFGAEATV
ncbi:MAG TPA: hypothetical protein ENO22_05620 [candidate division Zixibacteria bacterium]|nr:hypothetical protein [candidate division Zixibacteria bacterium]